MGFAEELRSARTQVHASQHTIASEAGISATFLADMERGRRMPSREVTVKLARALGQSGDRLMRFHAEESLREIAAMAESHPEAVGVLAQLGARVTSGHLSLSDLEEFVVARKESSRD